MNLRLFTLSLLNTILITVTYAQEPEFEWAKGMGSSNRNDEGHSIAIDDSGNVYTTGFFSGTVDFDPGVDIFNLTSVGGSDIFISKLDANGNFLWAKAMGGSNDDFGYSIAIDKSGNIYTTGYFVDAADFDPGVGTYNLTSALYMDVFISKLDADGNFLWAKAMGGSANVEYGQAIAIDGSGNVYTTGTFRNTADFNPDSLEVYNIISKGGYDIFISKLDSNGNFIWAKAMGGSRNDLGHSIAIDKRGNIYSTGYFNDTVDFDPDSSTSFNLSSLTSNSDIFISKLDANGDFVWAKKIGGGLTDFGNSIAIDDNCNVYTTGFFESSTDFDPGSGTFNLGFVDGSDIFISKLDSNGNFVWAKSMGGSYDDKGNSIAIDMAGNVYATGVFTGVADFDPGSGIFNLTSVGQFNPREIFISKLDANGNFEWAKSMGGTNNDFGNSIAIDISGNIYTTGSFINTAYFDSDTSQTPNLISVGRSDVFICKLSPCSSRTFGKVFLDLNENCSKDAGETNVIHTPLMTIQPSNQTIQTANGRWNIDSLPAGNYTATIDTSNPNWLLTCPPTQSFTVDHIDSCTHGPDFGFVAKYPCPAPDISIAMSRMRRGFPDQKIYVQACNLLSATDSLSNAYAIVEIDTNISVQGASLAYINLGNNVFEVQLGDLLPGECINFHFNTTVELSAVALQTLCLEAELFPQTDCVFDSTETPFIIDSSFTPCTLPWDKSSISVEGICSEDSVYFIITNTGVLGQGDMDCYSPMRFYIDGILVKFDSVMLQGQESITLAYAGTGETFSLEVDQHPLHPGHSRPNAHIENCGNGTWTPGIIPQMPTDDIDPIVDVFCGQVNAPLDPNDKRGFPLGVGEQKIIRENQNLEYMIRFQNVGTDTAVNVVIKDTLSEDFNIFTLQSGVSSHPYEFSISGQRELTWTFRNIMLPDSTTDNQNSNGFVMFKVEQVPDLPLGTVLENRAGIYFDFEAPVITNTSTHTIGEFNVSAIGTDEISLCDSSEYTWIDGNTYYTSNTNATYTIPSGAASGIDSIVRLRLSLNLSTSGIDTVFACDVTEYTWVDGNTYYANNNTATYTLQNEQGCDSVVTLNLTLFSSSTENYSDTICAGETFSVHGFDYGQTGNYQDTLSYQSGCDSIRFTISLKVDSASEESLTETICEDEVYSVHGFNYNQAGIYKDTLFFQNGCDSIRFTVNLSVDSATEETYTEAICEGEVLSVHGFNYDQTGVYNDTLFYQSGCDSIRFTVNLTVDSVSEETYSESICEGEIFSVHGFDYGQTGVYNDSLFNPNGCDSIRFTVNLTVDSASEESLTETICEDGVYSVHGFNYNQAGIYKDTLFFQSGCDSIRFTLHLTVDSASEETYTESICEGEIFTIHGFDYNQTGIYFDTLSYQSLCDSIVFSVDLTVNSIDSTFETQVTCTPADTGVFVFNEINNNTCDSVHTVTVSLDNCIGIEENNFFDFVSIYPNPAKDILIVEIKTAHLKERDISGGIYSLEGKLLQGLRLEEGTNTVNVNQHAAGLYFLQLVSKGEQKVFKVVLEP